MVRTVNIKFPFSFLFLLFIFILPITTRFIFLKNISSQVPTCLFAPLHCLKYIHAANVFKMLCSEISTESALSLSRQHQCFSSWIGALILNPLFFRIPGLLLVSLLRLPFQMKQIISPWGCWWILAQSQGASGHCRIRGLILLAMGCILNYTGDTGGGALGVGSSTVLLPLLDDLASSVEHKALWLSVSVFHCLLAWNFFPASAEYLTKAKITINCIKAELMEPWRVFQLSRYCTDLLLVQLWKYH